jgi:ABC-type bacteriocin/lantibiotic exporter with double-glycine peptidase domain
LNTFLISLALAFVAGASHIISGVPFVMQDSQYCGPASLSSVMSYYGDAVDQKTIGKAVYSPKLEGALLSDLEDYGRRKGFQTQIGRGRTAELKEYLSADKPVIVLVDLGFWVISKQHYLVVYGYNEQGFIAHNGFEAAHLYPYEEFENIWQKAGSSFLLIYR